MYKDVFKSIISEIEKVVYNINDTELEKIVQVLLNSLENDSKIITAGAGRMGYSIKCFSMRLAHLGFNTWSLGDTTLPSISKGDILIIGSGSGETESMKVLAKKAKERGVLLITFTCNINSSIGSLSDYTLRLPAESSLNGTKESIQPMKTYIEQSTLLVYDAICYVLMNRLGLENSDLSKNHSILE